MMRLDRLGSLGPTRDRVLYRRGRQHGSGGVGLDHRAHRIRHRGTHCEDEDAHRLRRDLHDAADLRGKRNHDPAKAANPQYGKRECAPVVKLGDEDSEEGIYRRKEDVPGKGR